jgi:hypothetical protein
VLLIFGCAGHEISAHDSAKMKTITTWHIGLIDEMAIFEKALDKEGEGKERSKNSVLLACDLRLRDDIASFLKNKYRIALVEESSNTCGYIRTDAVCQWGQYVSLDVSVYDQQMNLLAEIEVINGEDIFVKDDDAFAEYCADAIAEVIFNQGQ